MQSMTGFGFAQFKRNNYELSIHIKSVNSRFFEVRIFSPKEWSILENVFKKELSKTFSRGSLDVQIIKKGLWDHNKLSVQLNANLVKKWFTEFQNLKKDPLFKKEIFLTFDFYKLLSLPNMYTLSGFDALTKSEKKVIFKTFNRALRSLLRSRQKEGHSVALDLKQHLLHLQKNIKTMRRERVQSQSYSQHKVIERLQSLSLPGLSANAVDAQLIKEVIHQLEKADIHEELVRLEEHTKECLSLIKKKSSEGKRLDFYSQELLREVNTIGSKSQWAALTAVVVDSKTVIERIKEQVQNIQ